MRVGDIMTREAVTVTLDDTVEQVNELFREFRFHHVVVVDHDKVVGVISDRDLLKNLSPFLGRIDERGQDTNLLRRRVHQIMTRKPIVVQERTPLVEAGLLMLHHRINCLPVVDAQQRCVGILTNRDMMLHALTRMQQTSDKTGPSSRSDAA